MNFFYFASLIILLFVLQRALKTHTRSMQQEQNSFWSRELASNHVRKKPLDNLNYISIPLETLPVNSHTDNEIIDDCISTLTTLSERKIVNLTGITNTDLKFTYGTANITALSEYDQNYTLLVTTLEKWADTLLSLEAISDAKAILEYAVSIQSDVSKTYLQLADIYVQTGQRSQIAALTEAAEKLNSSSGKIIVRKLKELYPQ